MNLNYLAFFLIAFIPLILAVVWYHPNSFIMKRAKVEGIKNPLDIKPLQVLIAFILSFGLVYAYINLVIHQLGFYELFFTDIMKGSEEAKAIAAEFLTKYGDKHRHFGHGVLHGFINAFLVALPFIYFNALLNGKSRRYVLLHLSYWLVTSMLIGGLIAAFV